jgi:hypothetical protein
MQALPGMETAESTREDTGDTGDSGVVVPAVQDAEPGELAFGSAAHRAPPDARDAQDAEIDGYLQQAARTRRRRLVIFVGVAAVLVGTLVTVLALSASQPQIDRELAGKIRSAIPHISPSSRRGFAAEALAELEAKRLPEPMLKALGQVVGMPGDYMGMALATALVDPELVPLWTQTCPAGPRALAEAIQMSPGSAIEHFCSACEQACRRLDRTNYREVTPLAFAALALGHLSRHGALHSVEIELLRMLGE